MVMKTGKAVGRLLSALGILGVVACGGGAGNGDAVIGPTAPAGLTYTGVTSPAVIDSNNAVELAGDAFIGGETGSNLGLFNSVTDDQLKVVREIKLYEVASILGSALYKIEFNRHGGDSLAVKTLQDTVVGDCGGSVGYTVEMDDDSGFFTGSIVFSDYCNQQTTVAGAAGFSGQFNVDASDFLNFNLTINMVSLTSGSQSYDIDGDVAVDVSGSSYSASVNMLMRDSSGEIFWVKDYTLDIFEGVDYVDVQVGGRFYHPTHGYVDLSSILPVRTFNIDEWPTFGELQVVGGEGTIARLVINNNGCRVIADTHGDGTYSYDSGQMDWDDL